MAAIFSLFLAAIVATALMGTGCSASVSDDVALRRELEIVSQRHIYFGHQSVGWNIVDGIQRLAAKEGIAISLVEVSGAHSAGPAAFSHGPVAENGKPLLKLDSFARAIDAGPSGGVEIAFVKFCYVDFTAGTDARALFPRYQEVMAALKARHPTTTFVHVTAPLTTLESGAKGFAKRLLRRARWGGVENARREEYNALMREAYRGREPLFDLAAVESTHPDGTRETVKWNGRDIPVLVGAYTYDDGHLNEEGARRAARALIAVLAAVGGSAPR
jgi:hypothetical protein